MIVQRLHEGVFFHSRQSGQVEPRRCVAMFVIISFVLDGTETSSSQAMEFQAEFGAVFVRANENIGFFADADFVADR